MSRATDPQRMNWLWRLICEVAEVRPADVVEALHAAQVPVDQSRARSWIVSDRDDSFFPISIVEVERNLRSLLQLREDNLESRGFAVVDYGQLALESTMLETDPGTAGVVNDVPRISEDGADAAGEGIDFAAPSEL